MFLALTMLFASSTSLVIAQSDQAQSKIQAADSAVNKAFQAIVKAEKAGANVTDLLAQLNIAADLLAQAENAYTSGDLSLATSKADSAVALAFQVNSAAAAAEKDAAVATQDNLLTTVIFSVVGSAIFVVALFIVWRWFKGNYIKRLSGSKPEVVQS
jgi:hypothetical protein